MRTLKFTELPIKIGLFIIDAQTLLFIVFATLLDFVVALIFNKFILIPPNIWYTNDCSETINIIQKNVRVVNRFFTKILKKLYMLRNCKKEIAKYIKM